MGTIKLDSSMNLNELIPDNIDINQSNTVVHRGAINEFFIKGFERWVKDIVDYPRSLMWVTSEACARKLTDAQLRDQIMAAGFQYLPLNSHEVNARFLYAIHNIPMGTPGWVSEVIKYALNDIDAETEVLVSEQSKFMYRLDVYTNKEASEIIDNDSITSRVLNLLGKSSTAHTQLENINLFQKTTIHASVGAGLDSMSYSVEDKVSF